MMKLPVLLVLLPTLAVAQAQPEAAPAAPSAAVVTPAPAAAPPATKATISNEFGELKFGLLLQGWAYATSDTRFASGATTPAFTYAAGPKGGSSTFRIRRAEMAFDGKALGFITGRLMIDPVASASALQDFYVGALVPYHEIRFGQFKNPLTFEGLWSSGKLDFSERAIVTRTLGDQREMGVMAVSRGLPYVEYQLAVMNGSGKNTTDTGPRKNVIARAVVKPVKGVSVGASGQLGSVWNTPTLSYLQSNRAGVEAVAEFMDASVKAEYVAGVNGNTATGGQFKTKPAGYYVTAGYRFGQAQLVARYQSWESDTDTSKAECAPGTGTFAGTVRCVKDTVISAGLNYDLASASPYAVRLQLDYSRDRDEVRKISANEVVLVANLKF